MTVLHEQVEGTRWMVTHSTDPVFILITEAPPAYASAELAAAMMGALQASVTAHCDRCEAVADTLSRPEGDSAIVRRSVPHAPWCPWSNEAVDRLHEACRPPDSATGLSDSELEAEAERVRDYLRDLLASLGVEDAGES